eukprot:gene3364-13395_t
MAVKHHSAEVIDSETNFLPGGAGQLPFGKQQLTHLVFEMTTATMASSQTFEIIDAVAAIWFSAKLIFVYQVIFRGWTTWSIQTVWKSIRAVVQWVALAASILRQTIPLNCTSPQDQAKAIGIAQASGTPVELLRSALYGGKKGRKEQKGRARAEGVQGSAEGVQVQEVLNNTGLKVDNDRPSGDSVPAPLPGDDLRGPGLGLAERSLVKTVAGMWHVMVADLERIPVVKAIAGMWHVMMADLAVFGRLVKGVKSIKTDPLEALEQLDMSVPKPTASKDASPDVYCRRDNDASKARSATSTPSKPLPPAKSHPASPQKSPIDSDVCKGQYQPLHHKPAPKDTDVGKSASQPVNPEQALATSGVGNCQDNKPNAQNCSKSYEVQKARGHANMITPPADLVRARANRHMHSLHSSHEADSLVTTPLAFDMYSVGCLATNLDRQALSSQLQGVILTRDAAFDQQQDLHEVEQSAAIPAQVDTPLPSVDARLLPENTPHRDYTLLEWGTPMDEAQLALMHPHQSSTPQAPNSPQLAWIQPQQPSYPQASNSPQGDLGSEGILPGGSPVASLQAMTADPSAMVGRGTPMDEAQLFWIQPPRSSTPQAFNSPQLAWPHPQQSSTPHASNSPQRNTDSEGQLPGGSPTSLQATSADSSTMAGRATVPTTLTDKAIPTVAYKTAAPAAMHYIAAHPTVDGCADAPATTAPATQWVQTHTANTASLQLSPGSCCADAPANPAPASPCSSDGSKELKASDSGHWTSGSSGSGASLNVSPASWDAADRPASGPVALLAVALLSMSAQLHAGLWTSGSSGSGSSLDVSPASWDAADRTRSPGSEPQTANIEALLLSPVGGITHSAPATPSDSAMHAPLASTQTRSYAHTADVDALMPSLEIGDTHDSPAFPPDCATQPAVDSAQGDQAHTANADALLLCPESGNTHGACPAASSASPPLGGKTHGATALDCSLPSPCSQAQRGDEGADFPVASTPLSRKTVPHGDQLGGLFCSPPCVGGQTSLLQTPLTSPPAGSRSLDHSTGGSICPSVLSFNPLFNDEELDEGQHRITDPMATSSPLMSTRRGKGSGSVRGVTLADWGAPLDMDSAEADMESAGDMVSGEAETGAQLDPSPCTSIPCITPGVSPSLCASTQGADTPAVLLLPRQPFSAQPNLCPFASTVPVPEPRWGSSSCLTTPGCVLDPSRLAHLADSGAAFGMTVLKPSLQTAVALALTPFPHPMPSLDMPGCAPAGSTMPSLQTPGCAPAGSSAVCAASAEARVRPGASPVLLHEPRWGPSSCPTTPCAHLPAWLAPADSLGRTTGNPLAKSLRDHLADSCNGVFFEQGESSQTAVRLSPSPFVVRQHVQHVGRGVQQGQDAAASPGGEAHESMARQHALPSASLQDSVDSHKQDENKSKASNKEDTFEVEDDVGDNAEDEQEDEHVGRGLQQGQDAAAPTAGGACELDSSLLPSAQMANPFACLQSQCAAATAVADIATSASATPHQYHFTIAVPTSPSVGSSASGIIHLGDRQMSGFASHMPSPAASSCPSDELSIATALLNAPASATASPSAPSQAAHTSDTSPLLHTAPPPPVSPSAASSCSSDELSIATVLLTPPTSTPASPSIRSHAAHLRDTSSELRTPTSVAFSPTPTQPMTPTSATGSSLQSPTPSSSQPSCPLVAGAGPPLSLASSYTSGNPFAGAAPPLTPASLHTSFTPAASAVAPLTPLTPVTSQLVRDALTSVTPGSSKCLISRMQCLDDSPSPPTADISGIHSFDISMVQCFDISDTLADQVCTNRTPGNTTLKQGCGDGTPSNAAYERVTPCIDAVLREALHDLVTPSPGQHSPGPPTPGQHSPGQRSPGPPTPGQHSLISDAVATATSSARTTPQQLIMQLMGEWPSRSTGATARGLSPELDQWPTLSTGTGTTAGGLSPECISVGPPVGIDWGAVCDTPWDATPQSSPASAPTHSTLVVEASGSAQPTRSDAVQGTADAPRSDAAQEPAYLARSVGAQEPAPPARSDASRGDEVLQAAVDLIGAVGQLMSETTGVVDSNTFICPDACGSYVAAASTYADLCKHTLDSEAKPRAPSSHATDQAKPSSSTRTTAVDLTACLPPTFEATRLGKAPLGGVAQESRVYDPRFSGTCQVPRSGKQRRYTSDCQVSSSSKPRRSTSDWPVENPDDVIKSYVGAESL